MNIIIDGYNVLKWCIGQSQASLNEVSEFVTIINQYGQKKKHFLTIVFDGGPMTWPTRDVKTGGYCVVIYAGEGQSADDYIINYLDQHHDRPCIVVSSDNYIKQKAIEKKATVVQAAQFWKIVEEAMSESQVRNTTTPLHKMSVSKDETIDQLMKAADPVIKKEDRLQGAVAKKKSQQSKKEKQRTRVVKKL